MAKIHEAIQYMEKLQRPNGFLLAMLREAELEYEQLQLQRNDWEKVARDFEQIIARLEKELKHG